MSTGWPMCHFILFEFDQEFLPLRDYKDLVRALGEGSLSDLFHVDNDGGLTDQYWATVYGEHEYGTTFDEQDLHEILVKHGLSGRHWITRNRYPENTELPNDHFERSDLNVVEFGPHVKNSHARQISAQMESNCQRNAARLADVLDTVKAWFDGGGVGPPSDLARHLSINLNNGETERFNQVCREMFQKCALVRADTEPVGEDQP